MKFIGFTAASLVLAVSSAPGPVSGHPGSQCGLTDVWDKAAWSEDVAATRELAHLSALELQALPADVQKQVVITAQAYDPTIQDIDEAVYQLRIMSDALGAVTYIPSRVNGRAYCAVIHYPGDEIESTIFPCGSTTVIAVEHRREIRCR